MLSAEKRYVFNRMNALSIKHSLGNELNNVKSVVKAQYSFAVSGGAVGVINLLDADGKSITLPSKAIITGGYIDIITAMASSGGTGTIALGANSGVDLKAAVDADTLSGIVAIIPVGSAATAVKLTADRVLIATVAVEALTAGKFNLFLEYVLSE